MKLVKTIFLSATIALVSCKNESETPKVIYETEKKTAEVSYQKIDSTEINIADLPIKFKGTDYLLHPVGNVRVYSSGSMRSSGAKINQNVSYKISNYATPEITGYLTNVMFQHKDSIKIKPLTTNKMQITSINYLDELALKTNKHYLVYTLVDVDTNKDGRYDENDIKTLYISNINGTNFTKLTPDFHELVDWQVLDDKLYFRYIEDINKNGEFDSKDAVHYAFINLLSDSWQANLYHPLG
jgi:hypothetical protein